MVLLLSIVLSFLASVAQATTYYVSTAGSDTTGAGTLENPWRNPQKCFSAGTPLVAGDTCEVGDGTYTSTTTGRVVVIGSSSPQGTAGAPITLKASNPLGAIINAPNSWPGVDCTTTGCPFTGIYISSRNYYIIEGFQITRTGSYYASNAATAGVSTFGASHITIRNNDFHDIGRTVCNNGLLGQAGVYSENSTSVTIERNIFRGIGRLRNGESGCSTSIFQHDHGMYINGSTDLTIRRNICYDVNRGFCVNIKSNQGVAKTLRAKIHHNTFSGASPTGSPEGVIALTNLLDDIDIRNNLFHDPTGNRALWWYTTSATTGAGVTLSNNMTDASTTNDAFSQPYLRPASLVTSSNNTFGSTLGFVNSAGNDYRLAATSAAIDAGAALSGYSYNGAADIGAYESFTAASASITNTTISVTFGMALNSPIVATSGGTGWSVACSVSCGTLSITSVSPKSGSTSILDIVVSGWTGGQCAAGKTITVSFDPTTGAVRDSATIAETHQRLNALTSFSVTNNCTGSPPATPPSGPYAYYYLDGNANDSSGNGRTATASGGSYASSLYTQGYQCADGVNCYIEAPYGDTINPSTQSLTIAFSVYIPASDTGLQRTYFGTPLGTNQRLHVRTDTGTWRFAVQSYNGSTASDLAVQAGWNRVCLRLDSDADTMTPYVNGVAGTGSGSVRTYTSYALAGNFRFGLPSGHATANAGSGLYDQLIIWNSLQSCTDDWAAWNSEAQPSTGTLEQVAYILQHVYLDPNGDPVNLASANTSRCVNSPGAVAIVIQINCTSADCTTTGIPLRYSTDGSTFNQVVPDVPTADGVYFWGDASDRQLNRFSAGSALSGVLSHTAGPTQAVSSGTPSVSMSASTSLTLRYIVQFSTGLGGQTRYFKVYRQDGTALSSYTQPSGAQVCISGSEANGGG